MKKLLGKSLLAAAVSLAAGVAMADTLQVPCGGGGSKNLTYDWNPVSGALTYNFALQNCVPDPGDGSTFNGSMNGSGTLLVSSGGFDVNITSNDSLTVAGEDTGSITCTRQLIGIIAGNVFEGSATMNNCTFTVRAQSFDIVDVLSTIPFE